MINNEIGNEILTSPFIIIHQIKDNFYSNYYFNPEMTQKLYGSKIILTSLMPQIAVGNKLALHPAFLTHRTKLFNFFFQFNNFFYK